MISRKTLLTFLGLLVLMTSTAAAADWDGARVINQFNNTGNKVESAAFNCLDSDCGQVDTFSGTYPYGSTTTTPSTGNITMDYPADLQDHGYAVYFYSPGKIPKAYHDDWHCNDGSSCGPAEVDVDFNTHDKCTAEVNSFSMNNSVYKNEPLTVGADAALAGDIQSAFEENDNGVEHIPEAYKDPYYTAETQVEMRVYDENGNLQDDFTQSKTKDIFMSTSQNVEFQWTPDEKGNYTVEIATEVTDSMCAGDQPINLSSGKNLTVHPERPHEEYYTLLQNLAVNNTGPHAGEDIKISYEKISNFADTYSDKTPVPTDATYQVSDSNGNNVFSSSENLDANSNAQDYSAHDFTWTPQSEGIYTISVTGESEKTQGDYPTNSTTIFMDLDVGPVPTWDVAFQVNDGNGSSVENAEINLAGETELTDSNGAATITNITEGNYTYEISKTGYSTKTENLEVKEDSPNPIERAVTLTYNNTPPTVTDIPDKNMVEGGETKTISLNNYVQDDQSPDSEITWSISGNQNIGVDITSDNKAVLDPGTDWTGQETIKFTAEDPAGATDSDSMNATVELANTAPSVSTIPDVELDQDEEYREHYNLKDYISDKETSFSSLNISFEVVLGDSACGAQRENEWVSIVPDNDFSGSCTVEIEATDESGASDSTTFEVQVNNVLEPPVITSSPSKQVDAYSEYYYQMSVDSDLSDSELNFTVQQGPEGLEAGNEGVFTWRYPEAADVGNHSVSLQVSDGQNTDTQDFTLEVLEAPENEPPVPVINASPQTGPAPLTVDFDGSDSYDPYNETSITSYNWSFGEGGKAQGQQATYTYNKSGNYTASLTVEDDFGSTATETVQIIVNKKPEAHIDAYPVEGKAPLTVELDASNSKAYNGDISSFNWARNGSSIGSGSRINYTLSEIGNHTINLNITDQYGLTDTASQQIEVKDPENTLSIATENITVFKSEGVDKQLNASFTGNSDRLNWTLNNPGNFTLTDSGRLTNQTALQPGNYNISVTVTGPYGATSTADLELIVTENLYWAEEPQDQVIKEDESLDYQLHTRYIGAQDELTWEVTKNSRSFSVTDGLVQTSGSPEPGTYDVGLNVTGPQADRNLTGSFTVEIRATSDDGGDDDGSSSGSSGGGGGGGFYIATEDEEENLSENINVTPSSISLLFAPEENISRELSIDSSEQLSASIMVTGIENRTEIQEQVELQEGSNTVPVVFRAPPEGVTEEGSIVFSSENGEVTIPVTLTTAEQRSSDQEVYTAIFADDSYSTSQEVNFTTRVRATEEEIDAQVVTRVIDEDTGEEVFSHGFNGGIDTKTFFHEIEASEIDSGSYRIEKTVSYDGGVVQDEKQFTVGSGSGMVGSFFQSTSSWLYTPIKDFINAIIAFIL